MDLYHRLSVILIHVPSLTERVDDIPLLSKNFCEEICNEYGVPIKEITAAALKELCNLPWTGNIRELRNMIERLIILSDKSITDRDVIAFANPSNTVNAISAHADIENGSNNGKQNGGQVDLDHFASFQDFKDFAEKEFIKYKLEKNTWNVSKTADDLDIQRSHLYSKIEKFGLKRD